MCPQYGTCGNTSMATPRSNVHAGVLSTSARNSNFQNQIEAVIDIYTTRDAAGDQSLPGCESGFAYSPTVAFPKSPCLVRISRTSRPLTLPGLSSPLRTASRTDSNLRGPCYAGASQRETIHEESS